jgi:hypothetical protein
MVSKSRPRSKPYTAQILKIGINPYVPVPEDTLSRVFEMAKRSSGPIPVIGTVNRKPFQQTLVRYRGAWRLYLNGPMREAAGADVGDRVRVTVEFDPRDRTPPMNPALVKALASKPDARATFDALAPSRRKEILRYMNSLKTPEALARSVTNVTRLLEGKKPKGQHAVLRVGSRRPGPRSRVHR